MFDMKAFFRPFSALWLAVLPLVGVHAQAPKEGYTYSFKRLSQEPVKVTKRPEASGIKESKDTTFTLYGNASVPMSLYFVNGDQYNPLFNPNPTGIYLNKQHFTFFCDIEKSFRQNSSTFLEITEFSYLGRQYLSMMTMREDCGTKQCNYRCYNLFDLTNPKAIFQTSFSSIFQGLESYGDFNMDGRMDLVRAVPKAPENVQKGLKIEGNTYVITAHTVLPDRLQQLRNDQGSASYIFAKGDAEATEFTLIQHDWMIPLKDNSGALAKPVSYFQPYTPFDPKDQHLYDTKGIRIEKSRWSLAVRDFTDLEGAQQFTEELAGRNFNHVFIMADQYSRDISFIVLVGNYANKEQANEDIKKLKTLGVVGKLRDLRSAY
jgi:hypothetical protein